MVYSLSNYKLAIQLPEEFAAKVGLENNNTISIGGEGSYLDTLSYSYNSDMYSTKADATGSYVHDKNLDKSGTITINIHQMSPQIALFIKIVNLYYQSGNDYEGLQLSLKDLMGQEVMAAESCFFTKIPDQSFGQESDNQSWNITSGRINTID